MRITAGFIGDLSRCTHAADSGLPIDLGRPVVDAFWTHTRYFHRLDELETDLVARRARAHIEGWLPPPRQWASDKGARTGSGFL